MNDVKLLLLKLILDKKFKYDNIVLRSKFSDNSNSDISCDIAKLTNSLC